MPTRIDGQPSPLQSPPVPGRSPIRAAAALACALMLAAAGCGSARRPDEATIHGRRLTIYSSMPLEGPDAALGADVVRGERLALAEDGGRVGRYDVRLVALDAATPKAAGWDPARISLNARQAARDPRAVAYVGELNDGSSAVSIPLTNEAGLLQVSPGDTALALTTATTAVAGSPERYYPNLKRAGRTFARLVPSDRVQARALVADMQRAGVTRLALLTDEGTTALALTQLVQASAPEHGIRIVAGQTVDDQATDPRPLVASVLATRPDAVLYAGDVHEAVERASAVRLWEALAVSDPSLKLFAPDALVDGSFAAAIGPLAGAATYVTRPVLALRAYPAKARRFAQAFTARYGRPPGPEALYGYEAIRSILAAARRAATGRADGTLTRAVVVRAYFDAARSDSVLGPYAIDAQGDTSLAAYGAYRVVDGRLRYAGALAG
jgi:branched-chain amino acid transport system substrate-binding protein